MFCVTLFQLLVLEVQLILVKHMKNVPPSFFILHSPLLRHVIYFSLPIYNYFRSYDLVHSLNHVLLNKWICRFRYRWLHSTFLYEKKVETKNNQAACWPGYICCRAWWHTFCSTESMQNNDLKANLSALVKVIWRRNSSLLL